MKDILFRAKRIDNGKWVEGYYAYSGIVDRNYIITVRGTCALPPYNWMFDDIEIDKNTLCQYTGLTDKNGNRIWENDIVRFQFDNDDCPFTNKDIKKRIGKVFFSDFRASWSIAMGRNGSKCLNNDLFKYVQNGNRVEVIGNIFDNPELLVK